MMSLAIFDLDNTLINGDSDYSWGCFLVEKGIVDGEYYRAKNAEYYQQYQQGTMDISEFLAFSLLPLKENKMDDLLAWRDEFMQTVIEPMLQPKASQLIKSHADQQDTLLIITATNRFITEPIAERLGVTHLIATDPEIKNGQYTGHVEGVPCYQAHKVTRLNQWLSTREEGLKGSTFYSDSHNDIPLLQKVDNPVAVDPDEPLVAYANDQGWPIISLRA